MMSDPPSFHFVVGDSEQGNRLDVFLSLKLPDCSRAKARELILTQKIFIDGFAKKPSYKIKSGERVTGSLPSSPPQTLHAEPIDLDIIHEDEGILVINKPAGLVVHPAPGHLSGTLVNALLFHRPKISGTGDAMRPGIVHRLDKETSGLLLIAKTARVYDVLTRAFKQRQIRKTYLAVVHGTFMESEGEILLPIGRDPRDRKRMSTSAQKNRNAETSWQVRERFDRATLLELDIKTGRTHQIRVHSAAMGHPVVGDPVYGRRRKTDTVSATRQMLHAWRIRLTHPVTGCDVSFEAPIPDDMAVLMERLRNRD
ncbi:MAG: RluA family pseudouridine synthase [Thermodesulfobacteriota bacterium]